MIKGGNEMTIEPLGDHVLVKVLEQESQTPSGIILPETAQEKSQQALVVAISQDEMAEIPVEVGDKVLFVKYSGTEIKVDDIPHLLLESSDILARVTD
jgi:chaperonin GroES